DYFADHAAAMLQNETIATDASHIYLRYDPLGAVLAIMPWNFPLWQVFRFAAPGLVAGNVWQLKDAANLAGYWRACERALPAARAILDDFEYAMTEAMRALKVGDPLDRATAVGPLARLELLEHLDDQVRRSVAAGARLLCGGKRVERKGYFYEPTVLTEVMPG